MKKNSLITTVLFVLTMVLLFASGIQGRFRIWTFKPLMGVYVPTPNPQFTFATYRTAQFQTQLEANIKENFGFREPLIRLYNQFLFDFFKKTNNKDIVIGKDNWMYFVQQVNEYYGSEIFRWFKTVDEAHTALDRSALMMWKLRQVLLDYDVDLLVFMAPQKGFLFPEHLPDREFDTTGFNAREYLSSRFDEYGFPYIEMTQWFMDIKKADTLPYSLFPQTGAHWDFSAAFATDSLMRFMADLKGVNLPKLQFGPLHESTEEILENDYDIENLANLMRPIKHVYDRLYDAPVNFTTDSSTVQPSAIFVGTSFLIRMFDFVPLSEIFPGSQYWYYNSTVYYGKDYKEETNVGELDLLQTMLEQGYIVWFAEGDQMCKMSFGFAEKALMALCVSDDRVTEVCQHLVDSLSRDEATMSDIVDDTQLESMAYEMVIKHPERYFSELAGDSVPTTRNPRIPEALAIRDIKQDSAWMKNMLCQTVIHNTTLGQVLKMEARNLLNGRPLMRDEPDVVSRQAHVESLVKAMEERIRHNEALKESIREKAVANGKSFEEQLHDDAAWIVNNQIERGEIEL